MKNDEFSLFLTEVLKEVNTSLPETKAYINSVFVKYLQPTEDFSRKSIIIEFAEAKNNYSFAKFQDIGDWLLYGLSLFPGHFKNSTEEYYITIGQNSYYKCFKMLNNQWPLFEELSDNFNSIIEKIKSGNQFY